MTETFYETKRLTLTVSSRVYVIIRHRYRRLPMRSKKRREYFDVSAESIMQKDGHLDPVNVKLYSSMAYIHE